MSRVATGAQRRASAEVTSASGPRPCVSLTRWAHPRLLESVSRVLTYEPLHPLNVFAQHFYYAQVLLSAPTNLSSSSSGGGGSSLAGASPASPSSSKAPLPVPVGLSEDPFRCFTAAPFLRAWLSPYGVEALRTAMLPGWCGTACASIDATTAEPESATGMDVETKRRVLQEQHNTIIALLRCQDRATVSEKEFAAASEASSQNPVTPLFISEENEVVAHTAAVFIMAWIEQELQCEVPSAIMPAVSLAVMLVTLLQLHGLLSGQRFASAGGTPDPGTAASSSAGQNPSAVCAWVGAVSAVQAAQLYVYLYCRLTQGGEAPRPPSTGPHAQPRVQEALCSLVHTIDRVTASLSPSDHGAEAPALDPASLRHLLSCCTPLLSTIVHVAVPLCQWVSSDSSDSDDVQTGSRSSVSFLGEMLPQLASAAHQTILVPHGTPPPELPGSLAGFDLSACLPHLVTLFGGVAAASAAGTDGKGDGALSPSLSGLLSHTAERVAMAAASARGDTWLVLGEMWQWICLCLVAVWEDVFTAAGDARLKVPC